MAFCRLVFPLLVLSVVSCYASKVPLYMWGIKPESSLRATPLLTVSEEQLIPELHCKEVDDKLTVVFIEKTLSVEDFSRKNTDGETSFPYLHEQLGNAVYLPSVEHPLHALKNCAARSKGSIDVTGLENIGTQTGNFVFIPLEDAQEGESRSDLLHRHDDYMQEIVSELRKEFTVRAIYTAYYPSWSVVEAPEIHSRTRRAARASSDYSVKGLGLLVQTISFKNGSQTSILSNLVGHESDTSSPNNVTATLNFENDTSVTMVFQRKAGYWYFESVTVGNTPLTPVEDAVYAIDGFSYRCGQDVSFSTYNDTRFSLSFINMKVQPFFGAVNETANFGESFNCVGYFTAPIWSALLVVFFLLAITFYGIMMMLDIRTMDRFDDPKGKTITINAGE